MKKTTKLIEVQTPKGEPLFQLRIVESVLSEGEDNGKPQSATGSSSAKQPISSGGNGTKPQNGNGKDTTEEMMTDPQKRYLFRIMAERGKIGDEAHDELKRLFKVQALKDVTKLDARRMIEELLKKQNTGESATISGEGGNDGSSF